MTNQTELAVVEAFIPLVIGGGMALLALVGVRELLKEATVALKRRARA